MNKAKCAFIAVLVASVAAVFAVSSSATVVTAGSTYTFNGWFDPVSNDPNVVNGVHAGQAVPLKFSLGGDFGLDVLADGYPRVQQVEPSACAGPVDPVEEVNDPFLNQATTTNGGLSYDAGTDTYTYVWKTSQFLRHNCWQLVVKFDDGTRVSTNFKF